MSILNSDGSLSSVQGLITTANPGDIIRIPAGPFTWPGTLILNRGVTIQGAGVGSTVITGKPKTTLIILDGGAGTNWSGSNFPRLTGVTLQYLPTDVPGGGQAYIVINGKAHDFRFDHFALAVNPVPTDGNRVPGRLINIGNNAECWGVFDHFHFSRWIGPGESIIIDEPAWGGKARGDGSWAAPTYWGDPHHSIYFEDGIFESSASDMLHGGGRRVVRYCFLHNTAVLAHGIDSGGNSGGRMSEYYNNVYLSEVTDAWTSAPDLVIPARSCAWAVFNNRLTQNPNSTFVRVSAYRMFLHQHFHGLSDGINPLDKNAQGTQQDSLTATINPVAPLSGQVDPSSGDPTYSSKSGAIYARGIYRGTTTIGDVGKETPIALIGNGANEQFAVSGGGGDLGANNRWEGFTFCNDSLRARWIALPAGAKGTLKRWASVIRRPLTGNSSDATHIRQYGNGTYADNNFELRPGDLWSIRLVDVSLHQTGRGQSADLIDTTQNTDAPYGGTLNKRTGDQTWPNEQDGATGDGGCWFWGNKSRSSKSIPWGDPSVVSPDRVSGADPTVPAIKLAVSVADGPRQFRVGRDIFFPTNPENTGQRPSGMPYTPAGTSDFRNRIGPDDDAWKTFYDAGFSYTWAGGGVFNFDKANSIQAGTTGAATKIFGAPYPWGTTGGLQPTITSTAYTFIIGAGSQSFPVQYTNFSGTPTFTTPPTVTRVPSGATAGQLPTGVSFSSAGVFSYTGVSAVAGDYQMTLTATFGSEVDTAVFVLTIGATTTRIISLTGNLAFGDVDVGSTAASSLTITNNGNSALTATGITLPTGFSTTWTGGTIAPGASQNVTITFAPISGIAYSGTVTVASDKTSGTNTIAASGTGATRVMGLAGNLAFGNITTGQTATRQLTINNTGNRAMAISGINYPQGFSGDFTTASIAAGGSKILNVTFAPTLVQAYGGSIDILSNKTSGTSSAAASGTGTASATKIIQIVGDLAFGNVQTGTSVVRVLTLTNSGNSLLTVSAVSFPTGFSGDWTSGTIAAGASQVINVTFSPVSAIGYGGTVTVTSDATGGINTTTASGTGVAPATKIIGLSGNLAFGAVLIGTSPTRTLVIANTGSAPLAVSGITYPTGFTGAFSGTIAPGASQNVTVTFSPLATQSYDGTITVASDSTSGTNTIPVTGSGVSPTTKIINVTGNLAFGNVQKQHSAQRIMVISNNGTAALTVSNITLPTAFTVDWSSGSIQPGQSKNVQVTFRPTANQSYGGVITVVSDKTSGVNTIACTGRGRDKKQVPFFIIVG